MREFVRDKRGGVADSVTDAKYWIVTVDYSLIKYDSRKKRNKADEIPVCVHPINLIQMLQFWVPRSPELDEVLVSNLRMPFLFREFDAISEKVTIRIIERLNRFAVVDDLSPELLAEILTNDALRAKVLEGAPEDAVDAIIESMVAEEAGKLSADIKELKSDYSKLKTRVGDQESTLSAKENELQNARQALSESQKRLSSKESDLKALQESLVESQAKHDAVESDVKALQSRFEEQEAQKLEDQAWRSFSAKWIVIPMVATAILLSFFFGAAFVSGAYLLYVSWGLAFFTTVCGVWVVLVPGIARQTQHLPKVGFLTRIDRFRKRVLSSILTVGLSGWCIALLESLKGWSYLKSLLKSLGF